MHANLLRRRTEIEKRLRQIEKHLDPGRPYPASVKNPRPLPREAYHLRIELASLSAK